MKKIKELVNGTVKLEKCSGFLNYKTFDVLIRFRINHNDFFNH